MKNMKKLLRKAMVFTLTAAMLVGTPLTASAAGLIDLYQIEDGEGNVTGNDDNPSTGTVTATGTFSRPLEGNDAIGIYLDDYNVDLEYPTPASLTAHIEWDTTDGNPPADRKDLHDKMIKNLNWESSDTSVVALDGKFNGGSRETIQLHPKGAGTATVTASLKRNGYDFSASATVTVKQYATDLTFDKEIQKVAYVGDSIDLNQYVERYVDGKTVKENGIMKSLGKARKVAATSDVLTFSVKADPANAATLKNGILTIKKASKIKVLAVGQNPGEKVGTEWCELNVQAGVNAKTIQFVDKKNSDKKLTKAGIKVNDGKTLDVTVKVVKKDAEGNCTNRINWSSQKPEIVAVQTSPATNRKITNDEDTVTLEAKGAGKTQIIAKTSNGKSAKLTVTVSADLTKIKIEEAPTKLYSGQTIDLYDLADQYFEAKGDMNFTDAGLKWMFENNDKNMKKAASLNTKGVLSVKADLTKAPTKTIKVLAVNAKKVGDKKSGAIKSNVITINLEQINVTSITVTKGKTPLAKVTSAKDSGKPKQDRQIRNKTDDISIGNSSTYILEARGYREGSDEEVELDPAVLGWSASGSGKIVKASKNASNNGVLNAIKKGKSTITINSSTKKVSGTKTSYVAIKTTFKANVTVPTKTLTFKFNNKGIAAKKQNVTITPVMDKGTTTNKKKDIIWTAEIDGTSIPIKEGKISKYDFKSYAGKDLIVTARVKNGGPGATLRLPIVKESKKVNFKLDNKSTITIDDKKLREVNVTIDLKDGTKAQTPGKEYVSDITYTVNKEGIVRLRDLGNGKLEINPVGVGTVKITATTVDGKRASMTVKVKNVEYADTFWAPKQ